MVSITRTTQATVQNMNKNELIDHFRFFLKDTIRKNLDFSQTDQNRGVAPPPLEKPFDPAAKRIGLFSSDQFGEIGSTSLITAIEKRQSRRVYNRKFLSLPELSFLLWATQGITERLDTGHARRTVPSAGCRHALETYLCIFHVTGIEPGVYRYLPLEHQLLFEFHDECLAGKLTDAVLWRQDLSGQIGRHLHLVSHTLPYGMAL